MTRLGFALMNLMTCIIDGTQDPAVIQRANEIKAGVQGRDWVDDTLSAMGGFGAGFGAGFGK